MRSRPLGSGGNYLPGRYYYGRPLQVREPCPANRCGGRFAVRLSVGQAPYPGSEGDYFWGGAAGTVFWVDPKEDLTAVFMTQRFGAFVHYGRLIRTLVYQSIVH